MPGDKCRSAQPVVVGTAVHGVKLLWFALAEQTAGDLCGRKEISRILRGRDRPLVQFLQSQNQGSKTTEQKKARQARGCRRTSFLQRFSFDGVRMAAVPAPAIAGEYVKPPEAFLKTTPSP